MLRQTVTTSGYAVGNLGFMAKKTAKPTIRRKLRKNFIREWRKLRGLTQQQLGDLIGRTKATVSRIETGEIAYSREFLEAAADALGTHPGILLMRAPLEADKTATEPKRES